MSDITKDTLFKRATRASDKWENTNSVSRAMNDADEAARRKKTERLRALRMEAGPAPETKTTKAASKKTATAKTKAAKKTG